MSIFKTKDTGPERVVTGVDVLRQTLKARDHKAGVLLAVVREVEGLGITQLEAFTDGKADLSVAMLQKLTKILYPHSEYDPESGMLRAANRKITLGYAVNYPPRFDPKSSPYCYKHDRNAPLLAPQPVKPEKPKVKTSRPGWVGGWT
jgi:hypothetical protein